MTGEILTQLRKITPEEERILSGKNEIERDIYMSSEEDTIDSKKLLESGKLIQVRTHTRFVHFPAHKHNYIEVIYMCSGSTHHVINGEDVQLHQGELLFLNQAVVQEIYPAKERDIAVNFIILPEFFDLVLKMMGEEQNQLRDFIVDCLRGEKSSSGYLYFRVADILPIQNLVENLIWTIVNKQPNKRSINQTTMGLLILQLMNCMDKLETGGNSDEQKLIIRVLSYIEEHYRDGELQELANNLHYDLYWLSKEIKKRTGRTYTELLQTKRLNQATYLLNTTTIPIADVAIAIGYDNIAYFHRIFRKRFGVTPRTYRMNGK